MNTWRLLKQFRNRLERQRGFATAVNYGKVEVEGTKLYWERHGNGDLPVLFCPGLVGKVFPLKRTFPDSGSFK